MPILATGGSDSTVQLYGRGELKDGRALKGHKGAVYGVVFDAAGNVVKDAAQLSAGDAVSARLSRGTFSAIVKSSK